jgi:hypothetical protein
MNERTWLTCTEPEPLRLFLNGETVGPRKLGLYACGCCRLIWSCLSDERSRSAVEVAERFWDGQAGEEELEDAYAVAWDASIDPKLTGPGHRDAALAAARTVTACVAWVDSQVDRPELERRRDHDASANRVWEAAAAAYCAADWDGRARAATLKAQADLLRCIFGNPFRPVLAWNDGTVVKMARAIYEERAFDRLPILADALEEAGCANVDILNHCRQPGAHVRGCWVVDLLLGK